MADEVVDTGAKISRFEQHVQIGLQALIVMLVGWLAFTTNQLQIEVARLTAEQANATAEITLLRGSAGDRYSSSQAREDFTEVRASIKELDARIDALERQQRP